MEPKWNNVLVNKYPKDFFKSEKSADVNMSICDGVEF